MLNFGIDPRFAAVVGDSFGNVASEIRSSESVGRDVDGERGPREDTFTDSLRQDAFWKSM